MMDDRVQIFLNEYIYQEWSRSPTEETGEGDRFLDRGRLMASVFVDGRDAVRRDIGKSYISKPEGNNDAPFRSAEAR